MHGVYPKSSGQVFINQVSSVGTEETATTAYQPAKIRLTGLTSLENYDVPVNLLPALYPSEPTAYIIEMYGVFHTTTTQNSVVFPEGFTFSLLNHQYNGSTADQWAGVRAFYKDSTHPFVIKTGDEAIIWDRNNNAQTTDISWDLVDLIIIMTRRDDYQIDVTQAATVSAVSLT